MDKINGDYVLVCYSPGDFNEFYWNANSRSTYYLVSIIDGSRKLVKKNVTCYNDQFVLSPKGKYVIHFDCSEKTYYSYETANGIFRNITRGIKASLGNEGFSDRAYPSPPVGIATWLKDDKAILIYDNYDIWQVDPACKKPPLNITSSYGKRNSIKLRLITVDNASNDISVQKNASLLLTAFDVKNKYNGFYQKSLGSIDDPELLYMGPYNFHLVYSQLPANTIYFTNPYRLIKAKNNSTWIIRRMSTIDAPNYFLTQDFKTFSSLSDINPQKSYNWMSSELVHWTMLNGKLSEGILYKPENFDSRKKYPIIFNYYEKLSDMKYNYFVPEAIGHNINIPYFVSNGYIVFTPDIHYTIGEVGKSVYNSLISAANYLSKIPWIDSTRMAIQGHSFGAYETHYLITHSNKFGAAASVAGQTDFISGFGELSGMGTSRQHLYEIYQSRIGATLWDRPDLYIKNSPVFNTSQVTTPLLMMHNRNDGAVPFTQALEFFTALRRLNKRVWLLQYDQGDHQLFLPSEKLDYTIRLTQFFNHYLKDSAAPVWMTQGIPARFKGIETGYALDSANSCGPTCKICKKINAIYNRDHGISAIVNKNVKGEMKKEY